MHISYGFDIDIDVNGETPLLTQLDIHPTRAADVRADTLTVSSDPTNGQVYQDAFGNVCRRFLLQPGRHSFHRRGVIADSGTPDFVDRHALCGSIADLPSDVYVYLMASRYCETDHLAALASEKFGHMTRGWGMVQAITEFAHGSLRFDYSLARPTRSARDALTERTGVCRDFAHVGIALCRAMSIPARYATGYLGDIGVPRDPAPMDFSAWFEAYIGNRWFTFDARHNRPRIGRVVMAYGRDAADAALITSFGPHALKRFFVMTEEVGGNIKTAA